MDKEIFFQIYNEVLDSIDVGVHVVDHKGKTIIYNEKMSEIEGMNSKDVLEKNVKDVFSFHINGDSTLLQVLQKGTRITNVRQSYFNNKRQEITTINNTYPIMRNGVIIGAMEIARDVTKIEKMIRDNILNKGDTRYTFDSIIGNSKEIREVIEASKRATRTASSVLIIGETGTGKELIAQSIHNGSNRSSKPYISQNCAAIPEGLIEGILFGTKKGAFTGAIERPGLFEQADGGTLLLDEINSLDPSLQAKLLRVIQEKTIRRIGDTKDRAVDVRIIATINEDPIDAITNGRLRKDLYYRLSVVSLFIPPLRERRNDIRHLVSHFIDKYNHLFGLNVSSVEKSLIDSFLTYDWPGNVRELEHMIEGAMNFVEQENSLSYSHLPNHLRNKPSFKKEKDVSFKIGNTLEEYLTEAEIFYLKKSLKEHGGNITKTAEALGMSRQNLQYRLKKYGVNRSL